MAWQHLGMCQNLVPLVNIKIAGKWMFRPEVAIYRYWSIAMKTQREKPISALPLLPIPRRPMELHPRKKWRKWLESQEMECDSSWVKPFLATSCEYGFMMVYGWLSNVLEIWIANLLLLGSGMTRPRLCGGFLGLRFSEIPRSIRPSHLDYPLPIKHCNRKCPLYRWCSH